MRTFIPALALLAATALYAQTSCPTQAPGATYLNPACAYFHPCTAGTSVSPSVQPIMPECAGGYSCPPAYQIQACDTFTWSFGDGSSTITGAQTMSHVYASPGFYRPTVTISNALGSAQVANFWDVLITANPPAYVEFDKLQYNASEDAGSITFTLVRSGNTAIPSKVHYWHGDPAEGAFYQQGEVMSGDVTFAPGEGTKTFTMKIIDDHAFSGLTASGDVVASATDGTVMRYHGGYDAYARAQYVLSEVDPAPTATVSGDVRIAEGTATQNVADIVVTLSGPYSMPVQFVGITTDGTAKMWADYIPNQICQFPPLATQCHLQIPIVNDDVPEPDETFTVKVSGIYMAQLSPVVNDTVTVTIVNDDATLTPPMMQISTGARVSLKLDIGQAPSAPLTIPLQSSSPEVIDVPASVTFQAGQSTATFSAHALKAGLSRVTAAVPGTNVPSSLITVVDAITIVADPPAITLHAGSDGNVSLSIQPPRANAESVTVASTSPDVATAPASLTIPADGNATLTIHALQSGFGTIRIVTPDGLTFSIDVIVVDGPAPSATQIDPPKGPSTGGTTTTIVGQGLDAQCSVSFGAATGTNVTAVSNGIRVVVPPHDPGTVDVSVTCGATRIVLPSAFTFFAPRRRAAG